MKSCIASSPSSRRCIRSDSPSQSACIEQNAVSPAGEGTILALRIVPIGGHSRKVSSECQISVEGGGLPSLLSKTMSSGWSASLVENG